MQNGQVFKGRFEMTHDFRAFYFAVATYANATIEVVEVVNSPDLGHAGTVTFRVWCDTHDVKFHLIEFLKAVRAAESVLEQQYNLDGIENHVFVQSVKKIEDFNNERDCHFWSE